MPLSSMAQNKTERPQLEPICRLPDLRAIEARHAGTPLMERAGLAAAETARGLLGAGRGRVVVLVGPGNNGGDALVVARWLRAWFFDVVAVFPGSAARLPPDAGAAHAAFIGAGGVTTHEPLAGTCDLIVDGLFGIGLTRPPAPAYAALIEWANRRGAPILALDIPSGLDAGTGVAFEPAIRAAATVTFLALKPGLLTADGIDLCGAISVNALGLDIERDTPRTGRRLAWDALARTLPHVLRRVSANVHKGTFGTLAIIGGADGMTGAPILAGRAAIKLGSGKTVLGFVSHERPAFDPLAPELMLRDADAALDGADAIVAGPGLSTGANARAVLERAIAAPAPLAVDADALNLLAQHPELRERLRERVHPTLATPHAGEAGRLLGTDAVSVNRDRLGAAEALAAALNASVVLKGAGSVLAYPGGGFDINASGGPALATAGSGDVLAGMLGAFLAQRIDPKTALRYAVCVHGAAADALVARGVGPLGVAASELADSARSLIGAAASRRSIKPFR